MNAHATLQRDTLVSTLLACLLGWVLAWLFTRTGNSAERVLWVWSVPLVAVGGSTLGQTLLAHRAWRWSAMLAIVAPFWWCPPSAPDITAGAFLFLAALARLLRRGMDIPTLLMGVGAWGWLVMRAPAALWLGSMLALTFALLWRDATTATHRLALGSILVGLGLTVAGGGLVAVGIGGGPWLVGHLSRLTHTATTINPQAILEWHIGENVSVWLFIWLAAAMLGIRAQWSAIAETDIWPTMVAGVGMLVLLGILFDPRLGRVGLHTLVVLAFPGWRAMVSHRALRPVWVLGGVSMWGVLSLLCLIE